jgi:hypothetical protein
MLWLVATFPALAMIGGIATWIVAARSGEIATVADPVQRFGQMQLADLHTDSEAARRGLRGELTLDARRGLVELRVAPDPGDARLTLTLHHPSTAKLDRVLALRSLGEGRFVAAMGEVPAHAWNLQLHSTSGWRLSGRWSAGATHAALAPSVGRG